ncbi:MAG: polyprenol monophosphomannose synthase [Oligoflexia bacterium]|nr:polyprenol monophosphomannose synthase [Oligoflexia bacterium]
MKTLVVIPTYNEKDNIIDLIKAIHSIVPETHVLVVDDGSPDGTGDLVRALTQVDKRVFLLSRKGKGGLGPAYVAGFRWGLERGYEFLTEMDADWSHPPRYLSKMFELAGRYDFVIGSRYVSGGGSVNWSWIRKLISRAGSLYSRVILSVNIRDFTGGFNGWHAKVLEAVDLDTIGSDGYSFQIELKYRAAQLGFKFVEFPIIFEERREGQSKMSGKIVREAMWRVWSIRFQPKSKMISSSTSSPAGK